MIRATSIFVTVALTTAMAGCSGLPGLHHEIAVKELVNKTYKSESGVPRGSKYARHFERGWKQAYYNISKGGDVCPPSTPPEPYWSVKYQTPDGYKQIAAWYEGYLFGALAAERDLRPQFANVPLSTLFYRAAATACNEVPKLRLEASDEDEGTATLIRSPVQPEAQVNLSSFVPRTWSNLR